MAGLFRASALLMFAPVLAFGADLGRLTLLSGVGEPLRAEIEILSVQANEATSLAARIPSPDVFWRANLEPPPFIDQLRANVERRPRGRYVVTLSSTKPVENPFVQILVQLDSVAGRVVREYPFLLEEPGVTTHSSASPVAPPSAPQRRPADGAVASTYSVRAGDTLVGIARAMKPHDATLEQAIVALYQANEPAFVDGDMNRLSADAVLTMPPDGVVRSIDPAEARRIIQVHLAAVRQSSHGAGTAGTATGKGAAAAKPDAAPVPTQLTSGDHLRLDRPLATGSDGGSSASARGDDIVALQRALAESQQRIALLERELENVRKLLALKGHPLESVNPPERNRPELALRISGNATASERDRAEKAENGMRRGLVREHAGWLLASFLVGFAMWVVMPLKTARAWLRRRQRQDRATTHPTVQLSRTRRLRRVTS